MMWLVSWYKEYKATIQERVMKFHLCISLTEIHDVDGTFGLLQCTMDYTDHMLHAHTDRDPSSNDWSVLRAMTPMKEKGHVEHAGTSGV